MNAQFKVIKIDPDGSGIDYSGHLNAVIDNAKRCCVRCTIIFGQIKGHEIGPFVRGELEPLNDEARKVHDEIEEFSNSRGAQMVG